MSKAETKEQPKCRRHSAGFQQPDGEQLTERRELQIMSLSSEIEYRFIFVFNVGLQGVEGRERVDFSIFIRCFCFASSRTLKGHSHCAPKRVVA